MTMRKPLMGLCPIGKFVFSNEDAIRQKKDLQRRLREWDIPFVDIDDVIEDGLVKDQKHVGPVVDHFRAKGVECLFLPHCNFGTEGAVGMIARELGLPTLLWGPRDESPLPDGTRLRDTLCGLLASSKVLHKLRVPFSYIENCSPSSPVLAEGVDRFCRAVRVADVLRNQTRIAMIGSRIDFFWTTIINEEELLNRFGVQIVPVDMAEFIAAAKNRAQKGNAGYIQQASEIKKQFHIEGFDDDQPLVNILAVRDQMLAAAEDCGADAMSIRDFSSLVDAMGTYCFLADSLVSETIPLGLESDIHGALSALLLKRATYDEVPSHLTEFTIRHPDDDNAVLLWHAGAPLSMMHSETKPKLGSHWILPSALAGMTHFKMKDGPITTLRFDGDNGQYAIAVGQGQSIPGPMTQNNYTWMRVDDWPTWERTLIQGPFVHHCAMVYQHVADAVLEAKNFLPDVNVIRLDRPVQ